MRFYSPRLQAWLGVVDKKVVFVPALPDDSCSWRHLGDGRVENVKHSKWFMDFDGDAVVISPSGAAVDLFGGWVSLGWFKFVGAKHVGSDAPSSDPTAENVAVVTSVVRAERLKVEDEPHRFDVVSLPLLLIVIVSIVAVVQLTLR